MAYTPNLQDTQEAIGYTPTLADTQEVLGAGSSANQAQPIPQDFNLTAPVLAGLGRAGSNLLEDVGRLVKTNVTRQLGNMIVPGLGNLIQSRGEPMIQGGQAGLDLANKLMVGATGPQQAIAGLTQAAPYFTAAETGLPELSTVARLVPGVSRAAESLSSITSALGRIPVLSRLGRYATRGAIAGGETGGLQGLAEGEGNDQTNRLQSALQLAQANAQTGAEFGAGLAPIGSAAYGIGKVWGARGIPKAANNLYEMLSGNQAKDILNNDNIQHVANNYNAVRTGASQGYNQLGEDVQGRGYATQESPGFAGISMQPTVKFLKPSSDTSNQLDAIAKKAPDELNSVISKYKSAPSYENAHDLQSVLGKYSADLKAGINAPEDRQFAKTLYDARKGLQKDIASGFEKHGDKDLAERYRWLGDNWKKNVVSYEQAPAIYRAINGLSDAGGNITKELAKNPITKDADESGYDVIRNHLLKNPEQAKSVLAQAVGKAATKSGDEYQVNYKKLLKEHDNLPSTLKQFSDAAGVKPDIDKIREGMRTRKAIAKGVGIAAIAGLGKHYGLKHIESFLPFMGE